MKEISLSQGYSTIVDDEDYDQLANYKWYAKKAYKSKLVYAVRSKNDRHVHMGRVITNCPSGYVVDHINGNPLDNRRSNLRVCTQGQNTRNLSPYIKPMASQYKGVSWDNEKKRWRGEIHVSGKRHKLGRFRNEKDAAVAYNLAAQRLHGEFARLNVIGE